MEINYKKIAIAAEEILNVFARNGINYREAHEAVRCAINVVEGTSIPEKNYSDDVKRQINGTFGDTDGTAWFH